VPKKLIEVEDLSVSFTTDEGRFRAVDHVSFHLDEGEILGIVGESGCGKSVTALSMMRLVPCPPGTIDGGRILYKGRDLLTLDRKALQSILGQGISMIFKEPLSALSPLQTIGRQMEEAVRIHTNVSSGEAKSISREWLEKVRIPDAAERMHAFPYQLSGGMQQRIMIAMALMLSPDLIIADEPTTALDVTIQAQITDLVKKLQRELGMAIMWITHDLGVVAELADRINVMYAGSIIESGKVRNIYKKTRHPYTMGLLGSLPRLDDPPGTELVSVPGLPPDLLALPEGCAFAARCAYRTEKCFNEKPPLEEIEGYDHAVACWHWEEIAGMKQNDK